MVSLQALILSTVTAAAAVTTMMTTPMEAKVTRTYTAPEANQGVVADSRFFYAIDDSVLAKYDRATGARVATWSGEAKLFPHINACALVASELVCAASNYPATPMVSSVEIYDPVAMSHLRTIPLGHQVGSLTSVARRDGAWWAIFANYDGKGGEPGRNHTKTAMVKFDDAWTPLATWTFPAAVLDRFKPYSASGGVFGEDGLFYVTGHDRGEIYALQLPPNGGELQLAGIITAPIEGQAVAVDPATPRGLLGIVRSTRQVVVMELPSL